MGMKNDSDRNYKLLIHRIRQVVQVVDNGRCFLAGEEMKTISKLESAVGNYSIVVGHDGRIVDIGMDQEIKTKFKGATFDEEIDATGKSVIPGFVDGHTHAVWAGDRVHEFAMKLAGASYMEVHEAGGGINYTVNHMRDASIDELYSEFKKYCQRMVRCGTTYAEVKSGYGLDTKNEIKMLQVINKALDDEEVPLGVSVTYCGAHAVPPGMTSEEATEDVLKQQLPTIKALMDKGELIVDNIDVFCEKGVYDVAQTRRILEAGVKAGLAINFHGEELHRLNSAEMGAELKARAISHLEEISDEGIEALAKSGTIGVVLPTTAYILRLEPPPVRKMIEKGMAVALGSDFNPNAHCFNMSVVLHLACVILKMSMNEALAAATLNAAASIGKSKDIGSIEIGKKADLLILNTPKWEHLVYQLGSHEYIIQHVVKEGQIVHTNTLL